MKSLIILEPRSAKGSSPAWLHSTLSDCRTGMVHLIIDTNTFRKHLFGSWYLLTYLAGRAREATLQIYIPWVTYREVMTGIEDAVDRQIQRQEVARGISQIESAGGDPARAKDLSEALEHYRQKTIAETRSKFEAWIASSQAQILPLTKEQSEAAWEAYFAGGAPYRARKWREDIPDGFILHAAIELSGKVSVVHFISDDEQFRTSCETQPSLKAYKDIYKFCVAVSVPLAVDVHKEGQTRKLDSASLITAATTVLTRDLPRMRLRGPINESEPIRVQWVHGVTAVNVMPTSIIHLGSDNYLCAFTAKASLQCGRLPTPEEPSGNPDAQAVANYDTALQGHVHLRVGSDGIATGGEVDALSVTELVPAVDQTIREIPVPVEFVIEQFSRRYLLPLTCWP